MPRTMLHIGFVITRVLSLCWHLARAFRNLYSTCMAGKFPGAAVALCVPSTRPHFSIHFVCCRFFFFFFCLSFFRSSSRFLNFAYFRCEISFLCSSVLLKNLQKFREWSGAERRSKSSFAASANGVRGRSRTRIFPKSYNMMSFVVRSFAVLLFVACA